MTKQAFEWHSPRLKQQLKVVRWGHYGAPVLLFPTAGGDPEEAERMHLIGALGPLIGAGRIKVYCVDSIAGRAFASKDGSAAYRCALLNAFQEAVAHEVVPLIRTDCNSDSIEPIVTGASLGAFKATAMMCRYPWLFRAAIGMSGSYDLERLLGFTGNHDYYMSTPLCFMPNLGAGPILDQLRQRFVLIAYGQGRWESPDDAWALAGVLGAKGVPNRVDPWGPEYDHDWVTWRLMLPQYLNELVS